MRLLTGKAPPAGDVAGSAVRQDGAGGWQAGSHDGVREGDRGGQLDQGDVIAGIDNRQKAKHGLGFGNAREQKW